VRICWFLTSVFFDGFTHILIKKNKVKFRKNPNCCEDQENFLPLSREIQNSAECRFSVLPYSRQANLVEQHQTSSDYSFSGNNLLFIE
jgi:hypothetical protein